MKLEKFLSEKKSEILKRWFDTILDTYPAETSDYLKKQKNRFANPVGSTIFQGIEQIFNELLGEVNPERVSPFLDNIIRVRAVQDFTASQAVSFIFSLKATIREEMEKSMKDSFPWEELSVIDARIDTLAMLSFDIFMSCREKLYDIKANELRNMTFRLIERANRLDEAQEQKSEPREDQN
jgi:hypothetical protein